MLNAKLVVIGGDAKAAEISLSLPTTIGRGRDVTLTLPHPLVSRRHCELFEKDGVLQVRDLKSLNGTYVDSQRIDGTSELRPDHLLTIGNVTFRAIYVVGASKPVVTERSQPDETVTSDRQGQVIEFESAASADTDSNIEEHSKSIRDRKTTPGQRGKKQSDTAKQPAGNSSNVTDEPQHDTPLNTPVADDQPQHSVCAAMLDAGLGATVQTPESLSEIQQMLPDVPQQTVASGIDGLNPDEAAKPETVDEFSGIESDENAQSPVNADESALGSFIRKLPR